MRVFVAAGPVGPLSGAQVAEAIASGWQEADPQAMLAAVPLAAAGAGFAQAVADLHGCEIELLVDPDPTAGADQVVTAVRTADTLTLSIDQQGQGWHPQSSSRPLGRAIAAALTQGQPRRLLIEYPPGAAHDGGAGMLAALGAAPDARLSQGVTELDGLIEVDLGPVRELLSGIELELVVPSAETERQLLGLRGLTALRGREDMIDAAEVLAADAAVERFAAAVTAAGGVTDAATSPGSGAGGIGFAVLALGGRVRSGPAALRSLAGLEPTITASDLLVAGCESFDFATRGGEPLAAIAGWGAEVLTPVVVIAGQVQIGSREMRTLGVESAHGVRPPGPELRLGDLDAAELSALTRRIARTWRQ